MRTKILFLILFAVKITFVNAQMDDKFYFPTKDLKPIEWKNYEELKFPVEKDTISALILKPIEKPKATIFFFHGNGGNITYYLPITLRFVKNGFLVVMVDFRGYGKSTGIPTHKNIAEDGQAIFNKFLKMKEIKKTKKIIYGISIGTQIATLLAKNNQSKIAGLVFEGGMSSFGDIAAYNAPQYKDYLEKNYISPYSAKEDIKALNKISKLIIYSKEDKTVPFIQTQFVYNIAPEPKQFLEFKGEHMQGMRMENVKIIEEIDKMLNKKDR
jgi:pimeloyl-ACP methyl ester carboxylesterase